MKNEFSVASKASLLLAVSSVVVLTGASLNAEAQNVFNDVEPIVPPLAPKIVKSVFSGGVISLDGLDCVDCTFCEQGSC